MSGFLQESARELLNTHFSWKLHWSLLFPALEERTVLKYLHQMVPFYWVALLSLIYSLSFIVEVVPLGTNHFF